MVYRLETERLRLREWLPEDRGAAGRDECRPEGNGVFPAPAVAGGVGRFFRSDRRRMGGVRSGTVCRRTTRGRTADRVDGAAPCGLRGVVYTLYRDRMAVRRRGLGQGYATEAARAVLHDAFGRLGLPRVYSFTAAVNLRSERVMRRLGMRNLGGFDHPALPVGHLLRRHVLYAAARDTFEGRFSVRP